MNSYLSWYKLLKTNYEELKRRQEARGRKSSKVVYSVAITTHQLAGVKYKQEPLIDNGTFQYKIIDSEEEY